MNDHKEKALSYFADKYHCSQAVLAAYAEECEISEEQALKLGSCFGSGMRKGEVCGACTGALMVLGLLYGQSKKADADGRQRADKVNDMMTERFKEMNESYICKELLGCDVRTPEGLKYALDKKLFTEFCPKMVASAVTILDGIIEEMNAKETAE